MIFLSSIAYCLYNILKMNAHKFRKFHRVVQNKTYYDNLRISVQSKNLEKELNKFYINNTLNNNDRILAINMLLLQFNSSFYSRRILSIEQE